MVKWPNLELLFFRAVLIAIISPYIKPPTKRQYKRPVRRQPTAWCRVVRPVFAETWHLGQCNARIQSQGKALCRSRGFVYVSSLKTAVKLGWLLTVGQVYCPPSPHIRPCTPFLFRFYHTVNLFTLFFLGRFRLARSILERCPARFPWSV